MTQPVFSQTRKAAARTIGASVAAAYLAQYAPGLDLCVMEGMSQLNMLMADAPAYDALQAFFDGGRDHIAAIGLGLAERADELRMTLDAGLRESLDEIAGHVGRGASVLAGSFHDGIAKTEEFASFWLLQTGLVHDEIAATEAVDSGKGVIDALYGIVKAWGAFSLARKAWKWGVERCSAEKAADPGADAMLPLLSATLHGTPQLPAPRAMEPATAPEESNREVLSPEAPGVGLPAQEPAASGSVGGLSTTSDSGIRVVTIDCHALAESAANAPTQPAAAEHDEAACQDNQPCI